MRLPRRELNPVTVYAILTAGYTFFLQVVVSVNLVFQVQEAGLNPLQLVLVGTAMEACIFLCEVPTGLVADVYGRRVSVIIGLTVMGLGIMLMGTFPVFETILAGTVIWGFGYTFLSGARQAWIADEIGVDAAGPVYLRTAQIAQVVRVIAIPLSIGIATLQLNLPIIVGGALFIALGGFLAFTMSERGFQRPERLPGLRLNRFTSTFREGGRLVRSSPLLITVFCILFFYGAASEGFDRLWVAHFYENMGFPAFGSFEPVIWFGVLRMGATPLSIAAVELVRRRIDTNSHALVSRILFTITFLQVSSLIVFSLSGSFELGMLAFWSIIALSAMEEPLRLAWLNQSIAPRVRATVLSMSGQMDSIGQIAGGPALGFIGKTYGVATALFGTGVALGPALALYLRAIGQGRTRREMGEEGAPASS